MKYRHGFNKVKQEHSMIKGLKDFLMSLAHHDCINSMISGPIKPVKKASSTVIIRRLTPTHTGYKALIQSGAAVQEVFFVGDIDSMNTILKPYIKESKNKD